MKSASLQTVLRRLLKTAVWVIALAALGYWLTGFFLTPIAGRLISQRLNGAAVSMDSARWDGFGVRLDDLAIVAPNAPLDAPLLFADHIRVKMSLSDALMGRWRVQALVIDNAIATVDYDPAAGWSFAPLLKKDAARPAPFIPPTRLRNGQLRLRHRSGQTVIPLATVFADAVICSPDKTGHCSAQIWLDPDKNQPANSLSGAIRIADDGRVALSLNGRATMTRSAIFGNRWQLDKLALQAQFASRQIHLQSLDFQLGQAVGQVAGAVDFDAKTFALTCDIQNIAFGKSPAPHTVAYANPATRAVFKDRIADWLERFAPQGILDADLNLVGPINDVEGIQINGSVWCQGIRLKDRLFPYEIFDLYGEILFKNRALVFPALTARHRDWRLAIAGGLEPFGRRPNIWLRATSDMVALDEDVYRALPTAAQRLWYLFMPTGSAAIDFRYSKPFDQPETLELAVDALNCGVFCHYFPYPLEHLNGRLIFRPDRIAIQNVTAVYPEPDGRRAQISGQIVAQNALPPRLDLRIDAQRIPLDQQLADALPPRQQAMLKPLQTDARIDASLHLFTLSDAPGRLGFSAAGSVAGKTLVWQGLAAPLDGFDCQFDITPQRVQIAQATARRGAGTIALRGQIGLPTADAPEPVFEMSVDGTQYPLDELAWQWVWRFIPRWPKTLRLAGALDGHGDWKWGGGQTPDGQLRLHLRKNPILLADQPAGLITAEALIEPTGATLRDAALEDIRLDADWAAALPAAAKWLAALNLSGAAAAQFKLARAAWDDAGVADIEAIGKIQLLDATVGQHRALADINGQWDGWLRYKPSGGLQGLSASFSSQAFSVFGRRVDQLDARIVFDPDSRIVHISQFDAQIADGRVDGVAQLNFVDTQGLFDWRGQANINELQINRLLIGAAENGDEETVQRGYVSGTFTAQGVWGADAPPEGRLELSGHDLRLGKQTLIGKILTAAQLRRPRWYLFDQLQAEAYLRSADLVFDRIRLDGPMAALVGDGTVNLKNQELNLNFYVMSRLSELEPFLIGRLMQGLNRALWRIEARNTLADPQIRAAMLPILQAPLDIVESLLR